MRHEKPALDKNQPIAFDVSSGDAVPPLKKVTCRQAFIDQPVTGARRRNKDAGRNWVREAIAIGVARQALRADGHGQRCGAAVGVELKV